ncbi:HlyD family type I secretion periplasmic adaptor subunit [Piscinibacterium candidicorallinum]|uniref:Membrane fusion protein (MFP) family protein n=1 Tax=Piscinibacterium candidicorallinum TaxID=1793872 RepID=A0ABV7GWZ5_9BURK
MSATAELRGLRTQALDFAPDLLALQERPPQRLPRALLWSVSALFGLLTLWAVFGKLDIIVSAEGRLVPQQFTRVVQPVDGGRVQELLVREGDMVQAGQVLMRLDAQAAQADLGILANDEATRALTLRRIDAELQGLPFIQKAGDPPALYAEILAQYGARRRAFEDSIRQEQETLNKARQELEAARQVEKKLEQTLPILREQAAAQENLAASGFVSPLAAKDKVRERLEREQDLKAQQASIEALKAVIAQAERRIASVRSAYESELQSQRVQASGELSRLRGELAKQTHRAGLLELRAPVDGTVTELNSLAVGAVAPAGSVLLKVVPANEPLMAEVTVRNEDAGYVAPGQRVRIKVAAYPFQKHGMLEGAVLTLSADSADDASAQRAPLGQSSVGSALQQPLGYRALVKLDSQTFQSQADGRPLRLSAGLLVSAEVHQGRRTVLEYLLSPIQKVGGEAARER